MSLQVGGLVQVKRSVTNTASIFVSLNLPPGGVL